MFVQVIRGRVSDAAALRAALDQWARDLAPTATGWLGTTAGVTEDGEFVAVVRFDSDEAALDNSARPEQGEWWSRTARLFTDEPNFRNSTDVEVDIPGDPDRAGFVQVIHGHSSDPDRARDLMGDNPEAWAAFRPEILGSLGVGYQDGDYTAVVYFTSEEEAREGERKQPPPEVARQMEAMEALQSGQPTFLDLREPWLYSPAGPA